MTGTTKGCLTAAAALVAAAVVAGPILAQTGAPEGQPGQRVAPAPGEVCFVGHDRLIGASVVRPDGEAQTLGSVAELVLDGETGKVRCAVLASEGALGVGDKHRAVAWRLLKWDAAISRFTAAITPDMLEKMPEFAPKDPGRFHCGEEPADTQAAHSAQRGSAGQQPAQPAATYMLASEIVGCQVATRGHGLGACETLFIEPESGSAAFLSVASGGFVGVGGIDYVVPWKAAEITRQGGEKKPEIRLDVSPNSFASAPRLSDVGADLNDPSFRQKVFDFYGVRPEFDFERLGDIGQHATGRLAEREPGRNP
jgi:hypothetical protein